MTRTRIYAGFPSTIPPQFPPCNLTSPARGSKEAVSIPVIIHALNGCYTFDFMPLLCLAVRLRTEPRGIAAQDAKPRHLAHPDGQQTPDNRRTTGLEDWKRTGKGEDGRE